MDIFTYQDFKKEKGVLTFSVCEDIYADLLASLDRTDEMVQEIWSEFVPNCVAYAEVRGSYLTIPRHQRTNDFEAGRSAKHNDVIRNLNSFKRLAEQAGHSTTWFDQFQNDRKRMGDFACYVSYVYAVNAR